MKKQTIPPMSPTVGDALIMSQARPKRIMRIEEVEKAVGMKRCYIYRLIRQNRFPQRILIGVRAVGWDCESVNAWLEGRYTPPNF